MAPGDVNHSEIDEDLHSRQLAVYGRETMKRLFGSNVLISGINGLGAEIAKNLILAGVKSVTLHDEDLVELWDMSSNFTFSENDVGKNRALASVQKLQELNNAVVVSTLTTKLTKEHLSDFQVVVFTDITLERALEFNDYCHSHQPPIAFIKSEIRGLFGSIFRDFGSAADVDREGHFITSIHSGNLAYVEYDAGKRSELQNGDLVVFSEIRGMTELNDGNPRKINFVTSYSFLLEEDTRKFGAYVKGGIVRQVTRPKDLNFKPLRDALKDPGEFLLSDSSKSDRPPILHLAFQALDSFVSKVGRFPVAGAEEDAQQLISFATSINDSLGDWKLDDVNPKLLRDFAYGSRAVLNPMATMFGGIVGQEVVKACSGQCCPPNQFFYFDSADSLPTEPVDSSDFKPQNSRYDGQISVFGAKLQKKIEDAQVFVVGSGALGCEFLKNLALMGVSCGSQGKLTITDADVITKNDLSCQFLFRDLNIGQAKSSVAASAAASINPRFNIQVFQEHVGLETENVFDDDFWQNLTGVINASDNVSAGLYVDQRCLYFLKPLLESGALGAECYTQMAIPRLTERQAALCTARTFPHTIDHCLTWARSMFEDWFEKIPSEVNAYLTNPEEYTAAIKTGAYSQARDKLESILQCLDNGRTFEDCITWARLRFEEYFVNHVKQLVYTFPLGAATNTGAPFWSGPKSFAEPLKYSNKEPSHLNFIMSASILRAETFNIPIPDWVKEPKVLARSISKVKVPKFKPQEEVYYSFHPKEKFPEYKAKEKAFSLPRTKKRREQKVTSPRTALVDDLSWKLERCTRVLPLGFRMKPIQLDKDDDSHMDLIAPLANLRAKSYCIEQVQWLQAKKIIDREVIPAFGNTTAMAAGLVCLELYKLLDGEGHPYRNTYANLSTLEFSITQPKLPMVFKRFKESKESWTRWDRWELKGNPTIRDLIMWLAEKHIHVSSVSYGSLVLYKDNDKKKQYALDNRIKSVALWAQEGAVFPPSRRHLDVVADGPNGSQEGQDGLYKICIPMISIYFA